MKSEEVVRLDAIHRVAPETEGSLSDGKQLAAKGGNPHSRNIRRRRHYTPASGIQERRIRVARWC